MDQGVEYLLSYLQDEFRNDPGVRVKVRQRAGIVRSPDLDQDYDPETHNLHTRKGIDVRVRGREYFFPAEWAQGEGRKRVDDLIREIRSFLESGSERF